MKIKFFLWALLVTLVTAACSDEEGLNPTLDFISSQEKYIIDNSTNSEVVIEFFSSYDWQAEGNADWAVVTPKSGRAGLASVTVRAREVNTTMADREGVLTLRAGEFVKTATFVQPEVQVVNVKQDEFELSPEQQEILIEFETNIVGTPRIQGYSTALEWIEISRVDDTQSRALQSKGAYKLTVKENRLRKLRSTKVWLQIVDDAENVLYTTPKIDVIQEGLPVGTSTDLVTNDKKVTKIQTHTIGKGIPLVLMGDGFIDTELADGTYQRVMEKALENLFTEEPVMSLREYFDIWFITAVSPNNAFENPYGTRFGCKLAGGGDTKITGDKDVVVEYLDLIPELASDPARMDEVLAVVILNTEEYAGTTQISFEPTNPNNSNDYSEFAIVYCPIVDGIDAERFRQVLVHEAIGHGLAKLLDEYSYEGNGALPTSVKIEYMGLQYNGFGWANNICFGNTTYSIPWRHFMNDDRYKGEDAHGQILGTYEGAATYWTGIWRPTEESMMRSNICGFNVPSREAIYKRVMTTALKDEGWKYNRNEFMDFDQQHLPKPAPSVLRMEKKAVQPARHLPAPCLERKTLRD